MWYLLGEISIYLFAAAVLGFLIGWLLQGHHKRKAIAYHQKIAKVNLLSTAQELETVKKELAHYRNIVEDQHDSRQETALS